MESKLKHKPCDSQENTCTNINSPHTWSTLSVKGTNIVLQRELHLKAQNSKGRNIETCLEIGHKSHHSPAAAIIYVSNIYVHPPLSLLLLLLLLKFSVLQENKTKCSSCSSPSDSHSGTAKSTSMSQSETVLSKGLETNKN